MKKSSAIDRKFQVLRCTPKEKALLKEFWQTDQTRHRAMLKLVPAVGKLRLQKLELKKAPVRVGFPTELVEAMEKIKQKTGQPHSVIFFEAIRLYLKKND